MRHPLATQCAALAAATLFGCNAIWGVDGLAFDGTTTPGGGGGVGGAAGHAASGAEAGTGGSVGGAGGSGATGGAGGAGGTAPCVLGAFAAPTNVTELNTAETESHPWISADGLTLWYSVTSPATGGLDIWEATRTGRSLPFASPHSLSGPTNTADAEYRPSVTGDGLEMFFISNRNGGADIWVAKRSAVTDDFATAVNVAELNSAEGDWDPGISADGLTILLASSRTGAIGGADLWWSTRPTRDAAFGTPVRLAELSTASADTQPWISHDLLRVYLGSERTDGPGPEDIWSASRATAADAFSAPAFVAELCTTDREWGPTLTLDEKLIFFTSTRAGGAGGWDLWSATRDCLP